MGLILNHNIFANMKGEVALETPIPYRKFLKLFLN